MSDLMRTPGDGGHRPEEPDDPSRRRFLTRMSLGLSGLIGVVLGIPLVGYLLAPLLRPPQPEWIDVGAADGFQPGETKEMAFTDISPLPYAGLTAATAIYVRRAQGDDFTVFAVNCTHLGCPVNWLASAEIFLCPCHGGVFYRDGEPAAGPPQHPLYRYQTRVVGGKLQVQTRPLPPAEPFQPPRVPVPPRTSDQQQQDLA
jgi:menaquinol-cytochrome c reductase iron-sulfur subunit